MNRLRSISTNRLLAVIAGVVVLIAGAGIAQAAIGSSEPEPPRAPLSFAIRDALAAPQAEGISARVEFTNRLLPSGALPQGTSSPLLEGASGRIWLASDGRFRLELQSQAGDAQISSDGETITAYDAGSGTAYRFTAPGDAQKSEHTDGPPTLEQVRSGLAQLADTWSIAGPEPGSIAGRPSYSVRISPKDDGGLLGAARLAWDADHGVPLEAAVYADGQAEPVLELRATEISYGPISDDTLDVELPSDANIVDLSSAGIGAGGAHGAHGEQPMIRGIDAVQAKLPFTLAAPKTLAGIPRRDVFLADARGKPTAVVTYGEGLGGIVVVQQASGDDRGDPLDGDEGGTGGLGLPRVNIDGATGSELATALGTVVTFSEDGVGHIVAGSIPPQAAETAARELR